MSTPSSFDDKERADLVAYLDGELDGDAARRIEQKLALDDAARAEATALKKTWDLLDFLPRTEPSPSFTHRTMERLTPIRTGANDRPAAAGLGGPSCSGPPGRPRCCYPSSEATRASISSHRTSRVMPSWSRTCTSSRTCGPMSWSRISTSFGSSINPTCSARIVRNSRARAIAKSPGSVGRIFNPSGTRWTDWKSVLLRSTTDCCPHT